jgi:ATP-dependent RNA helicase DDX18/HAS1
VPPRVTLNIESRTSHARKAARAKAGGGSGGGGKGGDFKRGTGHTFSAANPYGKRAAGDTRQFVRG